MPIDLLLDTHALLWTLTQPEQLSPDARRAIETSEWIFTSVVSLQEIVIKAALGKLRVVRPVEHWLSSALVESGISILSITAEHAFALARLPLYRDHRDPFDRQLIAQAQVEALTLVTRDARIIDGRYDIPLLIA